MEIRDDAAPGEVAGSVMMAPEAERLVEDLRAFKLLDYGSEAWVAQHQQLERLNAQAHVNARNKSDPFVLEALITFEKVPVIVELLVTAETWVDRVFPRLQESGAIPDDCSMRVYYMLYHEALLVNLLECLLYHSSAVEALDDAVVDLVDFVARRLGSLVARSARLQKRARQRRRRERKARDAARASAATGETGAAAAAAASSAASAGAGATAEAGGGEEEEEDEEEEEGDEVRTAEQLRAAEADPDAVARSLRRRGRAIRLRVGVACVGVLRYLAEHASSLPLAGVVRMVETHDVILALVPLIENPPWARRSRRPPGSLPDTDSGWEKLVDHRWTPVPKTDLLRLTQPEAQAWLALHMLLSQDDVRGRWPMHSYRKATLMRVRRYLNPVLVDQIPPLAGLQRFLDESSVADAPAATADGLGRRVLLEASPALTEGVFAAATGGEAVRERAAAILRDRAGAAGGDPAAAVKEAKDEDKDAALWTAVAEASGRTCLAVRDRDSAALKAMAGLYEAEAFSGLVEGAAADGAGAPASSEDEAAVLEAAERMLGASREAEAAEASASPAPAPAAAPVPAAAKPRLIEVVDEMD